MSSTKIIELTPLAEFRAAHPHIAAEQDEQAAAFRDRFRKLIHDGIPLKTVFHALIGKAEQARLIGNVLNDFGATLAGKKLTRDFYEQAQDMFTDPATGQPVSFELLEWFMKVARTFAEPITSFKEVGACQQLLLKASGDDQFALEADAVRPPPVLHPPPNPLTELKEFFVGSKIADTVSRLRSIPGYWEGDRLRPELCAQLRVDLKPGLAEVDEAREFVRRELGI